MREIRPSGSVRGVRRKPYPYRDNPATAAQQRGFELPATQASPTGLIRILVSPGAFGRRAAVHLGIHASTVMLRTSLGPRQTAQEGDLQAVVNPRPDPLTLVKPCEAPECRSLSPPVLLVAGLRQKSDPGSLRGRQRSLLQPALLTAKLCHKPRQ